MVILFSRMWEHRISFFSELGVVSVFGVAWYVFEHMMCSVHIVQQVELCWVVPCVAVCCTLCVNLKLLYVAWLKVV